MKGVRYIENFLVESQGLYNKLKQAIIWDERMRARKTASFGVAYNYSQIQYPTQDFPNYLLELISLIDKELGFEPNNCIINFYSNGDSKMGFHSDQTDILAVNTGVAIVSLGSTRTLRFRSVSEHTRIVDYPLASGSLLYMTQEVQLHWQHAIPREASADGRMSLNFRNIVS